MVSTTEMLYSVIAFILSNWRVRIGDIYEQLGDSVDTAHKIMHDDLAFSKVSCRWISQSIDAWLQGLMLKQDQWQQSFSLIGNSNHILFTDKIWPLWFHLGWTSQFLHGTKFSSDDETYSILINWLKCPYKDLHAEGIQKLLFQW